MKILHTLLYVPQALECGVNVRRTSSGSSLPIYTRCAAALARTLRAQGGELVVLTNDAGAVRRSHRCGEQLNLSSFEFTRLVPNGIPFRSAHFKLDVIKAFGANLYGANPWLVDVDVLATGRLVPPLLVDDGFVAYDITDAMAREIGVRRIRTDFDLLSSHRIANPRWFGGELIGASATAYAALSIEIEAIWPLYVRNIDRLAHVGDETVVSLALNILQTRGRPIIDAGQTGIIARWWSARTTFVQRPFREITNVSLWHLPSDKEFISSLGEAVIGAENLERAYRSYVLGRLRARRMLNPILNFARRERKYVGRL